MGSNQSSTLHSLSRELERLSGPKSLEETDVFWQELFNIELVEEKSVFDAMSSDDVEGLTRELCAQMLVNDVKTKNFQRLLNHLVIRLSGLRSLPGIITGEYTDETDKTVVETSNALLLVRIFCRYFLENLDNPTLRQLFSNVGDMAIQTNINVGLNDTASGEGKNKGKDENKAETDEKETNSSTVIHDPSLAGNGLISQLMATLCDFICDIPVTDVTYSLTISVFDLLLVLSSRQMFVELAQGDERESSGEKEEGEKKKEKEKMKKWDKWEGNVFIDVLLRTYHRHQELIYSLISNFISFNRHDLKTEKRGWLSFASISWIANTVVTFPFSAVYWLFGWNNDGNNYNTTHGENVSSGGGRNRSKPPLNPPLSDLASRSSIFFLIITHHIVFPRYLGNPARDALASLLDRRTEHNHNHRQENGKDENVNADTEAKENKDGNGIELALEEGIMENIEYSISYEALYTTLAKCIPDEIATLMIYTILYSNPTFFTFVINYHECDILLLPLLRILEENSRNSFSSSPSPSFSSPSSSDFNTSSKPQFLYIVLVNILMLTENEEFCAKLQMFTVDYGKITWFKDTILKNISLGSLLFAVLSRVVKNNLTNQRDAYLHTNCLASMGNCAASVSRLHPYSAKCLLGMFEMLGKKHSLLSRHASMRAETNDEVLIREEIREEESLFSDFVTLSLEIINAILTSPGGVSKNSNLVYELLHRRKILDLYRSQNRFSKLIGNLDAVISYFNARLEEAGMDESWDVDEIIQIIGQSAVAWPVSRMRPFAPLQFKYEEESNPEAFFSPLILLLLHDRIPLQWCSVRVVLFDPFEGEGGEGEGGGGGGRERIGVGVEYDVEE